MKKIQEKNILETFLQTYCAEINYQYIDEDNDNPDFIIQINNKRIGIELTPLIDDGIKAIEHIIANINQRVYKLLQDRNLQTFVHVIPLYKRTLILLTIDSALVSSQIVDAICNNLPKDNASLTLDNEKYQDTIPDTLYNIRIVSSQEFRCHVVYPLDTGHLEEEYFQMKIQSILDKKELELTTYQKRYDDIWLLIITSGLNIPNFYYPPHDTKSHVYTSSFDSVVFFELSRKDYFELRLIK